MSIKFVNYPENHPYESGYYMVFYYNFDLKKYLYKGIWWDNEKKIWYFPKPGMPPLKNRDLSGIIKFMYHPNDRYYSNLLEKIRSSYK
jgi:hypothetical protein